MRDRALVVGITRERYRIGLTIRGRLVGDGHPLGIEVRCLCPVLALSTYSCDCASFSVWVAKGLHP